VTMILSMASSEFAIQVSDRRLTYLTGGHPIASDTANKQVLCGKSMCFGYTGLADLEGKATDAWLRDTLDEPPPNASLDDIVDHLTQRATEAVKSHRVGAKYRHMGFLGTGWVLGPTDELWRPAIVMISNFHDGNKVLLEARDHFTSIKHRYPPTHYGHSIWGAPLSCGQQLGLDRRIAHPKNHAAPWRIVRIFVETIRLAATKNRAIGKDLLATIIPRAAIDADHFGVFSGDGTMGAFMLPSGDGDRASLDKIAAMMQSPGSYLPVCMEYPVDRKDGITTTPLFARTSGFQSATFSTNIWQTSSPKPR
jgi:hypothetical protein